MTEAASLLTDVEAASSAAGSSTWYSIQTYAKSDVTPEELFRVMASIPNLALEDWERHLLEESSDRHPEWNMVAVNKADRTLFGALLGGAEQGLACICHIGVVRGERNRGIGLRMVQNLKAIAHHEARVIYLITTAGNTDANRFWLNAAGAAFVQRARPALEVDIKPELHSQRGDPLRIRLDAWSLPILHEGFRDERMRSLVIRDLNRGRGSAYPLFDAENQLCGLVLASRVGYRGNMRCLVRHGSEPTTESFDAAVRSSFAYFAQLRVFRIHALTESDVEDRYLQRAGFRVQAGETTFELWL